MPRTSPTAVDPVFAEVAKAIYGDIDPRELVAKFSPGSSDVHIDRPVGEKEARRQRKVALVGLGATGVASAAGLHAVSASVGEHKHRMAAARGEKLPPPKVGRVARLARKMKLSPTGTAAAIGGGLLALHGVELGADALGIHAQTKALRQANKSIPKKPVTKAFRLKPLNTLPNRVPSLRAKRVKLTPLPANPRTRAGLYQPMSKGVRSAWRAGKQTVKNVSETTRHAEEAARNAAKTSNKVQALIPSPRAAALGAGGTVALLTGATYAGTRSGTYAGTRAGARPRREKRRGQLVAVTPVAKSEQLDVTWTGEITKVDTEQRQVFGWASVSAINGEQIVDLQGDIVPIEEMEKSAYRYVVESRKGGDMHKRVAKADEPLHTADMIESFVVTPEKLEKMGLPADALPHGWWVGYHVNDDAQWDLVKSGGRKGFSIHGAGRRTPVSKSEGTLRERAKKTVEGLDLGQRAKQAVHPPAVRLHSVKSSAVAAMGYQPQTRRLAVEMRSRPGRPYQYKMKRGAAEDALTAPSKGHHFATQVRGKAKRAKGYTPADRARLFLDPVSKAAPKEIGYARPQTGHAGQGFGSNARPGTGRNGRRITDLPPKYNLKGNKEEFRRGFKGGFGGANTRLTYKGPGGSKYANKRFQHAFKQRVTTEATHSPHPGAFKTGVRAGRYGLRTLKYGPYAAYGAVGAAAVKQVTDDHREASRRLAARRQGVGKRSPVGRKLAAVAIPAAAGYAGLGLGGDLNRRLYNPHGAGITRGEAFIHPIRVNRKAKMGQANQQAEIELKRAASTKNPKKAELHRIRAERSQERSDKFARKAGVSKAVPGKEPSRNGTLPGDNRNAEMARTRRSAGLGTAGVGYLLASRGKEVARTVSESVTRAEDLTRRKANRVSGEPRKQLIRERGKAIRRLSGRGGTALMAGGLVLAGEGAYNDLHNRGAFASTRQELRGKVDQKLKKSAFGIEDDRLDQGRLSKAFDPERSRHGRQDLYAGAATGGAVLAGAGAAKSGAAALKTRKRAATTAGRATASNEALREHLARMSQPTSTGGLGRSARNVAQATKLHRTARGQGAAAGRLATKAKRLSRLSGGSALGAAALGAGAFALHDYDRRRGGRSYGY